MVYGRRKEREEMKIRAYDIEKDKLIYSDLITENYEFSFSKDGDLQLLRDKERIKAEIDLCSEIYDCNGCEIYQNDILKIEPSEEYITHKNEVVRFGSNGFNVNNIALEYICLIAPDYEIIGNTHTKTEV